jgi:hypothetical protein
MDITVNFDGDRWSISPDPAEVNAGTPVFWILRCQRSSFSRLLWKVYFDHRTPFPTLPGPLLVTTVNRTPAPKLVRDLERALEKIDPRLTLGPDHEGAIGPAIPTEPGDYKYGIEVRDAETGEVVGDDDPRLIVLS